MFVCDKEVHLLLFLVAHEVKGKGPKPPVIPAGYRTPELDSHHVLEAGSEVCDTGYIPEIILPFFLYGSHHFLRPWPDTENEEEPLEDVEPASYCVV